MGIMKALAYGELDLSIEDQVRLHFTQNCYPPIPLFMVDVAMQAIIACCEEDYFEMIELPDGVSFRNGEKEVSASQIIESLRLDAFVMQDPEWEDE